VCTVLLRFDPRAAWPVLLAAVRDEFLGRPWDPPGPYWPGLVGGRDRVAGGTWLAVSRETPVAAGLLNGPRLPEREDRPSRGGLVVDLLSGRGVPSDVSAYDSFHLLRVGLADAEVWSWDGDALTHRGLPAGDHVLVNAGVDVDSPVVRTGRALLAATPSPDEGSLLRGTTSEAWGAWTAALEGEPSAADGDLLVRREFDGRTYGSSSVTLLALGADGTRYDFSRVPARAGTWRRVLPG